MLCKNFFEERLHYVIGKGTRVHFWEDKWCMRYKLRQKILQLYKVLRRKNFMIADMCVRDREDLKWNFDFRRRLTKVEIREATNLLNLLQISILPKTKMGGSRMMEIYLFW